MRRPFTHAVVLSCLLSSCTDIPPAPTGTTTRMQQAAPAGARAFTTIDVPGALSTHAWQINPAGTIVGNYQGADGSFHVLLFSQGTFTSIDFPSALATAPFPLVPIGGINALGDIVSTYCDHNPCALTSAGSVHGFLRTSSSGAFASLDFPGAIGTSLSGINPRGDVVGLYVDTNLKTHGFLWANP